MEELELELEPEPEEDGPDPLAGPSDRRSMATLSVVLLASPTLVLEAELEGTAAVNALVLAKRLPPPPAGACGLLSLVDVSQ